MTILLFLILAQQPTTTAEGNWYKASLMSSASAHIMDMTTTGHCIGKGTCIEKNPFLAPFSSKPLAMGAVKGMIATSLSLLIHEFLWKKDMKKLAIISNFIITGTIGTIAARNSFIK